MFSKKTAPSPTHLPSAPAVLPVISPPSTTLSPRKDYRNTPSALYPRRTVTFYPLAVKLQARNDYIAGKGSAEVLAKKHGIKLTTFVQWCKEDKWTAKRAKYMAVAKAKFDAQMETPQTPIIPTTDTNSAASELDTQRIMIARAIREAKSGRELRDLAMAQKLVLDSWSLVTGHPRPGTRRQSKRGSSAAAAPASFEPLEPDSPVDPSATQ